MSETPSREAIHREQAARTREILAAGTVEAALRSASDAGAANDALVAEYVITVRAAGQLACASGCSWCCHVDVSGSFVEMAHLAAFIDATFSADARAGLDERLRAHCAESAELSDRKRATGSRPCPLLVEGACSAYAARPMACRGWNSADADACRVAFLEPDAPPSIPVHRRIRGTALALAQGMQEGARDLGLDDSPMELTTALQALLTRVPEATERWLAGERVSDDLATDRALPKRQDADGRWRLEPGS